ncbi:MAG: hypothetical protein J5I59_01715 [Saprospiraceae bacterium]|nr:hypothetical protein [Saprospiraceae bacterium]
MKYFIYLLFLFGAYQQGISQNVQEYNSYIDGLEGSGQGAQAAHLKSIYRDMLPTVYFDQGEIKTYGNELPKRLISSSTDIFLNEKVVYITNLSQVEIIVINYKPGEDLNQITFKPEFLQQLTALQYLVYVPAFDVPIEKFNEVNTQLPANVVKLVRVSEGN